MTTRSTASLLRFPAGYSVRPATLQDAQAILRLINACELEDLGETEETLQILNDYWRVMDLEHDARIAADANDTLVGYADQPKRNPVRLRTYVCVHPEHRGRGLGSALTEWVEERAAERIDDARDGARVRLQFGASETNKAAIKLLQERGYAHERSFYRMVIDLDESPLQPRPPEGLRIRPYLKRPDDRPTWEAVEEAFDDHWGNVRDTFEEWSEMYERETFDPALWFLAVEGDQIAGASLCSDRGDMGWVGSLSVRRPWRRRGVASALLHHTFGEFYRRGQRRIGLGVDASSLTGATRVYERVGMRVDQRTVMYSKMLRDGVEVSTEAVE